ncbi:MAG TPA: efflux RND transporter periplasmic adaptor subunit [Burkholderiales bacterium]|nr:efflux RND transporter periplasmic adaptor subunit [Burkholderiales bacterium]
MATNRFPPRSAAALVVLTVLVAAGCDKPSAQQTGQMPPPEVSVVTVQPREIAATFEQVGQTAGVREVEVRPRVTGILQRWNYKEGSAVQAGRSLFTIDPAPFQTAVTRADADLASALAKDAQSKRDVERLQPLYEQGMISRKAFDDAVSAKEVAAAGVMAAQAALAQAKLDLEYTRVEAPISGVTSRALKSEGSLVEAQQTLLTTISQVDPIHVIFSISESENLRLQREAAAGRLKLPKDGRFTVTLRLSDGTTYERPGRVDFSDVRINPGTGTSEARAVLPNSDQRLRPGQFVRVTLTGATYINALAVPQRAVLEGPTGKIVMTVNAQGMVEPRPVEVGAWAGADWIITSGINPGDRVIVDGVMKARPGAPVKIAEAKPVAPAEASQPAARQQ